MSAVWLAPVTPENWRTPLAVAPQQKEQVADRITLLARAFAYRNSRSRAYCIKEWDMVLRQRLLCLRKCVRTADGTRCFCAILREMMRRAGCMQPLALRKTARGMKTKLKWSLLFECSNKKPLCNILQSGFLNDSALSRECRRAWSGCRTALPRNTSSLRDSLSKHQFYFP